MGKSPDFNIDIADYLKKKALKLQMSEKNIIKNQTIQYYDQNAADFVENTRNVDFHVMQDEFIEGFCRAKILTWAAAGRDTKIFSGARVWGRRDRRFEELCALASEYTGHPGEMPDVPRTRMRLENMTVSGVLITATFILWGTG